MTDVLSVYEEAFGGTPTALGDKAGSLSAIDMWTLLSARDEVPATGLTPVDRTAIWPLISHHRQSGNALFSDYRHRQIRPRVLALLLAHDGLVVADPLDDVQSLVRQGETDAALALCRRVTQDLADVEALLAAGVLKLTSQRPALNATNRAAVLEVFGVDPSMQVFTNLVEAAVTVEQMPQLFKRWYAPQVDELYQLMGLNPPLNVTLSDGLASVRRLAAAVLEVSWQLAVCAVEPACDPSFTGPLEQALALSVIKSGLPNPSGFRPYATRHVSRIDTGAVPNLNPVELTIADALVIREGDVFEEFRAELRQALDQFETWAASEQSKALAIEVFEERMLYASQRLASQARRSSLRERVRDASIPTALAVVSETALNPISPVLAGAAAAGTAIGTLLWQWMAGRNPQDLAAAHRYFTMLGGNR